MSYQLNWCFTVNNYTVLDDQTLQDMPYKYLIYGREVGEEGTPTFKDTSSSKRSSGSLLSRSFIPLPTGRLPKATKNKTKPTALRKETSKSLVPLQRLKVVLAPLLTVPKRMLGS